jgi:DNA-binding NarL/FixJ family response regulator
VHRTTRATTVADLYAETLREREIVERGERVRVLIADEHSLFREAVRVALESEPELEVVAEAHDGLQAATQAERAQPDVAVVDANLPNGDGIRATALIRAVAPDCRVLVLHNEEDMQTLVAALQAGASGFLTKGAPLGELIDATRVIHRGDTYIPQHVLGSLLSWLIRRRKEQGEALRRAAQLTRREREVLAILAEGGNNDSIAQTLVISPQTARTHIQNVLGKLGVHSRLEAAAFVTGSGLDELLEQSV